VASVSGKGLFISIEGPDGAGKTTQARILLEKLKSMGLQALLTREPGGTSIGEEVRKILLNPYFQEMTVSCEAFLYCAARSQLVSQVIRPSLEKGIIVISDRFVDSSIVYQGYAGGENLEMIRELNLWATGGLKPDKTFLLDLQAKKGLQRLEGKNKKEGSPGKDRMEQKDPGFHSRVREGFLQLARRDPQRFQLIDAEKPPEEVHQCIWEQVKSLLRDKKIAIIYE
jgi:dTMP kinase